MAEIEDIEQPIQGKVYAVSDYHREINIEETCSGKRWIIQPEHWDSSLMCELLDRQVIVFAKGMLAAGLPVLMRATVKYFQWGDD